jgi:pimeloyl-ACP methyl ester carboxylesterase
VRYTIAYPPGRGTGDQLPVCVLLHGAGWDRRGWFDAMRFHRHLADAVIGGSAAFALAACDGGQLYWRPQASGEDPQAMVVEELLPALAKRGLATGPGQRIAVLGCSMGGYGALLLGQARPELCAAVVASSPAIAVDDAGSSMIEFARQDVVAGAGRLRGIPLRVDCGESDPLLPGVLALRRYLPDPAAVRIRPGCHDPVFWEHLAPTQLPFVAAALAD